MTCVIKSTVFLRHLSPIIFGFGNLKISSRLGFLWQVGGQKRSMFFIILPFKAGGIFGFVCFLVFCFVIYGDLIESTDYLGLFVYGFLFSWHQVLGNICFDGGES